MINKFFMLNSHDRESYRTGKVLRQVQGAPTHWIVQFDSMNGGDIILPMEIISIDEMSEACDSCNNRLFLFFASRKKLDIYLKWVDTPSQHSDVHNIVTLKH